MEVVTLNLAPGEIGTINSVRPHNSQYRATFADGAGLTFMVIAGGRFVIQGNGLPVVIHIEDDIAAGISAL